MQTNEQNWEKFDKEFCIELINGVRVFQKRIGGCGAIEDAIKDFIRTHFIPRSEAIGKEEIRGIVPKEKEEDVATQEEIAWMKKILSPARVEADLNLLKCGYNSCRNEIISRLKKLGIEI